MARKLLRRFFPSPSDIKNNPALHFLGDLLHDPNLFHLNRHSVSVAFFWGLFIAMLPIPGQMAVAAMAALFFRCNLPIAVALVWITNPLTMAFFFFIAYEVGKFILQIDSSTATTAAAVTTMDFGGLWDLILDNQYRAALNWLGNELGSVWKPFLLGSVVTGLILGGMGYFGMQAFWRWHAVKAWNKRKLKRTQK
jgi:uncharacterized protein